jgi:hypothetical protein
MVSTRPFRAFVSYAHADAAFAARLQRKLESYRLPRRLAGQVEPLPGQTQGRIGPVFRDRADLSAATDLSAAVREGIAASSALVVVASPDAAASRWVAKEITLFRELHPGAPILVALARGAPSEALPDALRGAAEPLCADFRKEGDGKRLAFLKIVAGLADLPLDALVQRDAQRQLRRVTAVTAGALIMVLITALLLVMALQAREEAERRRVTADETFRKLLTDVRRGLEGTGNVELMSTVNQIAIDYYRRQGDLRSLPDDSLDLRARLLQAAGADDEKQNRLDDALAKFAEAHSTTAGILAKKPNDPEAIFAHAQSEFYVGSIANKRKDRSRTMRHWKAYVRLAEWLAKVEPGTTRSFLELGYAYGNLCDLNRLDEFDLKAAERQCAAAVRAAQAAFANGSEVPLALANRYGALGIVQFVLGRYDESVATCRRQGALIDPLIESQPRNVEYVLRRSWADICMANAWIHSNRPAKAVDVLRQTQERQSPVFPARSTDWRLVETRFRTNLFLARALYDLGQPYKTELREAERQRSLLAAFGAEYAAKSETIWAATWPQSGDAK